MHGTALRRGFLFFYNALMVDIQAKIDMRMLMVSCADLWFSEAFGGA